MKEIPVSSRIINAVYFNPEDGQLCIRFKNGEERRFLDVPEPEVVAMCKAKSPGQHYLNYIRTRFQRDAA